MTIFGTAGDDSLAGTTGADIFDLSQGGNDAVGGALGNDTFRFGAAFAAGDFVSGGDGNDVIALNGNYFDGLTITGAMMTSVEKIKLGNSFSYALTLDNSAVTIGHALTVDGSALTGSSVIYFDGTAETTSGYGVIGGAGDDILWGGAAADTFDLSLGGNDQVHGGAGDDLIVTGSLLTAADRIDGGEGNDLVVLGGDYTGANALTFDAATLVNVERLVLLGGTSYALTIGDDNIPSAARLQIDASRLGAADTLTLDISAVDGQAVLGAHVALLGSDGNDTVRVGGNLVREDRLDGGLGINTLSFDGDTEVTLSNGTVQNFSLMQFVSGHDYAITTARGNVAVAQTLTVDGSALASGDVLDFNGARATSGAFAFNGGAGNDILAGGTGNDTFDLTLGGDDTVNGGAGNNTFTFGGAFNEADRVDGGSDAGFNTVVLSGDYTAVPLFFAPDTMTNIDRLELHGAGNFALVLAAETVAMGQTLTLDASPVSNLNFVTFSADLSLGNVVATGHDGVDIFSTSQRASTLHAAGGDDQLSLDARDFANAADVLDGGDGNDVIQVGHLSTTAVRMIAADQINGGAGVDVLDLMGNYASGLTFNATTVLNVEKITVQWVLTYKLTSNNATVAAGQVLTVDGAGLSTNGTQTGTLNFNGAAETDGSFILLGGLGNDTLKGGALADTIRGRDGADILTGGGDVDTFVYGATSESTGATFDTIKDMGLQTDKIDVAGTVTTIDGNVSGVLINDSVNFDTTMATAVSGHLGGTGHAILVFASSGVYSGHVFLVVDQNGTANYQSGGDLVIDVTGATGLLGTYTFI